MKIKKISGDWVLGLCVLSIFLAGCGSSGGEDSSPSSPEAPQGFSSFSVATASTQSSSSGAMASAISNAGLDSDEWMDYFNAAIVRLFSAQKSYLRNTANNDTSLNMLDVRSIAINLALIYQATDEITRTEFEQYWLSQASIEGQLAFLGQMFDATNSPVYESGSVLWPHHDHFFKQDFIDWIYGDLQPSTIDTVDYLSNSIGVRSAINSESGIYVSDAAVSNNTKLTQWAYQLVDEAVLSATSVTTEAALLRDYNNRLTSIEALVLQGSYKQLISPEGQTTLIPIQNTGLALAVIQPVAGQYDYYLSVLPAMLRDASNQTEASLQVHIPIIDSRWLGGDLEPVLVNQGVQQLFDEVLADLTNLDAGGQYVSELRYEYDLTLNASGLSLASGSILTTTLNPDNQFFNQDQGDGDGTFGGVFTQGGVWPCVDASSFYVFEPLLLALVDTSTGAISYLAEIDRLGDSWVDDCGI